MSARITSALTVVGLLLGTSALWAQQPDRPAPGDRPAPQDQPPQRAGRPTLGIEVAARPANAEQPGLVVGGVAPDGPAGKAGMKAEDVIIKADDKAVKDMRSLMSVLGQHKPGDKVTFHVLRDGKEQTVTVTLGERTAQREPGPGRREVPGDRPAAFLGVLPGRLTPEAKERLGVTADQGLVVENVLPNSPAAKAGIKRDDVITKFDGQILKEPQELRESVQKAGVGKKVTVEVQRQKDKKDFTVELQAPPRNIPFPGQPRSEDGSGNFPGPVGGPQDRQREIDRLKRQVEQLQRRIQELEQSAKPPSPPKDKE